MELEFQSRIVIATLNVADDTALSPGQIDLKPPVEGATQAEVLKTVA